MTDADLLGVTLCFKCKIPFDEFTEMGQHKWWFRMNQATEDTPGFEWQELQCPMHQRTHKFPVLVESWCPECSVGERKRIEKEGDQHVGHAPH